MTTTKQAPLKSIESIIIKAYPKLRVLEETATHLLVIDHECSEARIFEKDHNSGRIYGYIGHVRMEFLRRDLHEGPFVLMAKEAFKGAVKAHKQYKKMAA